MWLGGSCIPGTAGRSLTLLLTPMSTRLPLFALALLLPLAACETEPDVDTTTVETTDPVITNDPMVDDTMGDDMMDTTEVTAQSTLDAVPAEGLTAMAPSAAIANIDSWIAQLDGADFTNASEIRDGLTTLRGQLQESPLDGNAIGETLVNLGTWTSEAAGGDAALSQLGSALSSAGETLTGGSM